MANEKNSAKELEHFERIRQSFESVDQQKKKTDTNNTEQQQPQSPPPSVKTPPQTISEALEALRLSGIQAEEVHTDPAAADAAAPVANGDHHHPSSPTTASATGSIKGKRHGPVRTASGHSTTSSKGKGKATATSGGSKSKNKIVSGSGGGADSDSSSSLNGPKSGGTKGYVDVGEDDDDYVVKTDHLSK